MNGLVVTSKGLEKIASIEIKELINADCEMAPYCVAFNFSKFEDLCLLCYKCQSVDKVIHLLGKFNFNNLNEIEGLIDKLDLDKLIENKTFKVECIRQGVHDFKSTDVEIMASKFLLGKFKKNGVKIDMKEHEIIFFICVFQNDFYFGVDFAGIDLNKRSYKIFLHPGSIRGTIAYALVRETGFKKNDCILDPFSKDGIIPIEAALYASGFPVNYYNKEKFAFTKLKIDIDFEKFFMKIDKQIKKTRLSIYDYDQSFRYVDSSRKNSKIAGVDKYINFSRIELEWLDIKFKRESVDVIATSLPNSKNANLDKIYNEFFYQGEYILKKDGKIAVISRSPEMALKHASKHNFTISKEREVWSGEQSLKIFVFEKKTI